MESWTTVADLLWRNAIAVIPLAILVGLLCRCLPSRPSTRHTMWLVKLAVITAERTELQEEVALGVELLDAVVIRIGHVDISCAVHRHSLQGLKLPITVTS